MNGRRHFVVVAVAPIGVDAPMPGNLDKSFNVTDSLAKDFDAATKQAILSMVKAPPTTIGMGRPVALTGLEILWRLHIVLGHASIDQVMATLSKTEGMRAGVVTYALSAPLH